MSTTGKSNDVQVRSGVSLGVQIALGFTVFALVSTGACVACGAWIATRPADRARYAAAPPSAPDLPAQGRGAPPAQPSEPACDLELVSFTTTVLERPGLVKSVQPVRLAMELRNKGARRVKAAKMSARVVNSFGESVVDLNLEDGSMSILPGKSAKRVYDFDDNQFDDDEPSDLLRKYTQENLRMQLLGCRVAQAD